MDEKDQIIANLNRTTMALTLIILGFRNFVADMIMHVQSGQPLDDATIATLRRLGKLQCQIDDLASHIVWDAISDPVWSRSAIGQRFKPPSR
jgi:hypothetical protein